MTTRFARMAAALFVGFALANLVLAGPISREESERQAQVLDQLKKSIAADTTDAAKLARIERVMKAVGSVDLRRRILTLAASIPGPPLEAFLTGLVTSEDDAGLRSQAATTLGHLGSEKCFPTLVNVAANDKTTGVTVGDIYGRSSARRAAIFALAELGTRFPKLADDVAAKIRGLPANPDPNDKESLADARTQALYQITREGRLLEPFYERLKSKDAKEREKGVVAFRFLKLKTAPAEIVGALKDGNAGVRSWAALVLGEIGDPKSADALIAVACETKEDLGVRCNAIHALGATKTVAAKAAAEKLLKDEDAAIRTSAAILIYRITGKKVEQFPAGYNAD